VNRGRVKRDGIVFVVLACAVVGCQQKMADQPSYKPLEPSGFFADRRSARPPVSGTIARGHLHADPSFYTGRRRSSDEEAARAAAAVGAAAGGPVAGAVAANAGNEDFVDKFPFPITEQIVEHGYQRYMIYCVVCHDPLGTGHGKIVERGYTRPPSLHIERLRTVPIGHIFAVMTEGYGSMPSYTEQIPVRDRWAIAAYVRALQLSQHFPADQLPADLKKAMEKQTTPVAAGGGR
jgi:mono/diheme cytochrome c family protein